MSDKEIFKKAIAIYGEQAQENQTIEECAELIQAINHKHRGREHNIPEEIADVEIMLEQLKIINNCADEVGEIRRQKINRLYQRICKECKNENIFLTKEEAEQALEERTGKNE